MLDAGLPLLPSLNFYVSGLQAGDLQKVVLDVATQVGSGKYLSKALSTYPEVFNSVYVSLVETGESSGRLVDALKQLADLTERQVNLKRRIVAAATYPAALLGCSIVCSVGFIYFILPSIVPLMTGLGVPLPWPTRLLLNFKTILPVAFGSLVFLIALYWNTGPQRKRFCDDSPNAVQWFWNVVFAIPMIGPTIQKVILARVLFAMNGMMDAGMTLTSVLHRCEGASGNILIARKLKEARNDIVEGASLARALSNHEVFPDSVLHMLAAGEESSQLSDMTARAAALFEEDVNLAITDMTASLEPIMMCGSGLFVGFIVLAAMLPIVQLIQNLT